jgi:hypothetical protein
MSVEVLGPYINAMMACLYLYRLNMLLARSEIISFHGKGEIFRGEGRIRE